LPRPIFQGKNQTTVLGAHLVSVNIHQLGQQQPASWQQDAEGQGQADSDLLCAWLDGLLEGHDDVHPTETDQGVLQEMLLEAHDSPAAALSCAVHVSPAIAGQPPTSSSSSSACSGCHGEQREIYHPLLKADERPAAMQDLFDAFDAFLQAEHEREHSSSCPSNIQQLQQQQQERTSSNGSTTPSAQELHSHSSFCIYNSPDTLNSCHTAAGATSSAVQEAATVQLLAAALLQQQQQQQQQPPPMKHLCEELPGLQAAQQWVTCQPMQRSMAAAAAMATPGMLAMTNKPHCSIKTTSSVAAMHHSRRTHWAGCNSTAAMPVVGVLQPPLQPQQQLLQPEQHSQIVQQLQESRRLQLKQLMQERPHLEQVQRQALLQQHAKQQLQDFNQQQLQRQANIQLQPQPHQPLRRSNSSSNSLQSSSSQLFARRRAFNPLTPNKLMKVKAQSKVGTLGCHM
jgi:hypothetical protein